MGSIPRLGRSPGEGNVNRFQCSCLENPMDRGACQAKVHSVAKSSTWLKQLSTWAHFILININSDSSWYSSLRVQCKERYHCSLEWVLSFKGKIGGKGLWTIALFNIQQIKKLPGIRCKGLVCSQGSVSM